MLLGLGGLQAKHVQSCVGIIHKCDAIEDYRLLLYMFPCSIPLIHSNTFQPLD